MARNQITLSQLGFPALGSVFLLGSLWAAPLTQAKPEGEQTESSPPSPTSPPAPERKPQDPLLQLIKALTPEQKAKLMESIKTWQQLGPELKTALRAREKAIRKTLSDEVQAALEGTSLTNEQRDLFEKRYKEERKKLETALRTEFEARRKAALEEMTNALKKSVLQGDPQ